MHDCEWLLKEMKNITFKFEGRTDFFPITEARTNLEFFRQNRLSDSDYFDQFKNMYEAFEYYGRRIENKRGLIEHLANTTDLDHPGDIPKGSNADKVRELIARNDEYKARVAKKAKNRTLAMSFLSEPIDL